MDLTLGAVRRTSGQGLESPIFVILCIGFASPAAPSCNYRDYLPRLPVAGGFSHAIPITHEWGRHYDARELTSAMDSGFAQYHARTCLITVVSLFEACLGSLRQRLERRKGLAPLAKDLYKPRLVWAFGEILRSTYGNPSMIDRLPALCLDIDHARRIRNLWMHNRGLLTLRYRTDAISLRGQKPAIDPAYTRWSKAPRARTVLPISQELFLKLSRSHVEALHHLHAMLQQNYFGQKRSYGYSSMKKRIVWKRLLEGT